MGYVSANPTYRAKGVALKKQKFFLKSYGLIPPAYPYAFEKFIKGILKGQLSFRNVWG